MSACNAIVTGDRAVMLTDSSLYNGTGEIIGFDRKAFPVESWNGAVSGRGNCWGIVAAKAFAERFGSFDEFVARSAADIEREHKAAVSRGELVAQSLIEIVVIGWSESADQPRIYTLSSEGAPGYVWRHIDEYVLGPGLDAENDWYLHRQGLMLRVDNAGAEFDPMKHGIAIMEAQRRQKSERALIDIEPIHVVGGHVWLTEVDRDGTFQRVIHNWHDAVGEPIRPKPMLPENRLPRVAPYFVPKKDTDQWFEMKRLGLLEDDLMPGPKLKAYLARQGGNQRASAPATMNRAQRRAAARAA